MRSTESPFGSGLLLLHLAALSALQDNVCNSFRHIRNEKVIGSIPIGGSGATSYFG